MGEIIQFKHKRRWKLAEVRSKNDDENKILIMIVDGKKHDAEEVVDIEKEMENIRKLGADDVERLEEEESERVSKKKALASMMRAQELKTRFFNSQVRLNIMFIELRNLFYSINFQFCFRVVFVLYFYMENFLWNRETTKNSFLK